MLIRLRKRNLPEIPKDCVTGHFAVEHAKAAGLFVVARDGVQKRDVNYVDMHALRLFLRCRSSGFHIYGCWWLARRRAEPYVRGLHVLS